MWEPVGGTYRDVASSTVNSPRCCALRSSAVLSGGLRSGSLRGCASAFELCQCHRGVERWCAGATDAVAAPRIGVGELARRGTLGGVDFDLLLLASDEFGECAVGADPAVPVV